MINTPKPAELPIGEVVAAIKYETLWTHEPSRCCTDVDAVSMGVRIEFEDSDILAIRWLMKGFVESIALGERGQGEPSPSTLIVDASDRWPRQIGARLDDVKWSLHTSPGGEAPWACRLVLSGGHDLVIALGECDGDRISYIPDGLLVIGSSDVAKTYRPIAAYRSAWGD